MLVPVKRSKDSLFEYACHESNVGMEGILTGFRAEEQASATVKLR